MTGDRTQTISYHMGESQGIKVGDWAVLPAQNLLERDGNSIRIKPRTMDVLVYLANHAGEVVSADELINSVWKGQIVGDGTVYQNITQLRHALGGGSKATHFIETIPKRGYRLVAPVTVSKPEQSDMAPAAEAKTNRAARAAAGVTRKGSAVQILGVALMSGLILAMVTVVVDHYVLERDQPINGPAVSNVGTRRYELNLGLTQGLWETGLSTHVALSHDGKYLAYAARVEGMSQLYLRPLDQLKARPIPGTQGAVSPFFSHDGEWLAFYDETVGNGQLKKVPVGGGTPVTLAETSGITGGGSWSSDDTIVFATRHVRAMPWNSLVRIPAMGGTPEVLLGSDSRVIYEWPDVLPGGEAVLFTLRQAGQPPSEVGSIGVLSLETGDHRILIEDGYFGRYAPSGHVLFAREGALWAVPFDLQSMQTTGPASLVLDGVQVDRHMGGVSYAFSDDGLLVYTDQSDGPKRVGGGRALVWVDRETKGEEIVPIELRCCSDRPRISPDGQRVALEISAAGNIDIWIYDFAQRRSWRLTVDPSVDEVPLWYPDSERVLFLNHELGGLFSRAADLTGQIERLTESEVRQRPESFSHDGKQLVVTQAKPGATESDLHLLSLDGESESRPLVQSQYDEAQARVSPDGHWMAYMSNRTGQDEVHVRRFPNTEDDGPWQASRGGGAWPLWGPDGTELFYRAGDAVMAVSIETEPTFSSGSPQVMFSGDYVPHFYDVSPDGGRFLMMKPRRTQIEQTSEATHLVVVENWFEELRRLAPPAQ